ncbi:hypothetical protein F5Y10DRAFT_13829 [Nemania abortiva]|nr:hypothetical protein F5Y10DRAFT_13829 [Nemania abortiva]
MRKGGKLLGSMLGIAFLVKPRAAMAPDIAMKAFFPNTTTTANSPTSTGSVPCFPLQDPDCCIVHAVCECNNGWCLLPVFQTFPMQLLTVLLGTFIAINEQYGATSLCNPPGAFVYGDDIGSVPGWCC